MSQNKEHNRRIVLARRPQGSPEPGDFRLESIPVPEPSEGQVLLRTEYLSLDPYMRGRMSDAPSYADPVQVDDVMVGGRCVRLNPPATLITRQASGYLVTVGGRIMPFQMAPT